MNRLKIEEKWIDCSIYLVGFYVEEKRASVEGVNRLINKMLVFDSEECDTDDSDREIENYIIENFNNVVKVDYIEIWNDGALRTKHKIGKFE